MQHLGPIAHLAHVTLAYEGDVRALDDVSLEVRAGERLCVLGANGSGKSTLAGVLAGLIAPDGGSVDLVGRRVLTDGVPDYDAYVQARRMLGLVFQNPDDQIVTSVVDEDVAFGPENLGVPPTEIDVRVQRELHRTAMEAYAKADPTRLSGGQKQRVAIAGALAMEPALLVLDEPGALLDVRGRTSIMRVMGKLKALGTTVVHITHFMEEALEADRVIVMGQGRIVLSGSPSEVFSHDEAIRALGLEEPWTARLATRLQEYGTRVRWTCDAPSLERDIVATCTDVSEPAPMTPPGPVAPHGPIALEASHVSYSYEDGDARADRHAALDDVSLAVRQGERCAIIGQTGSGKSTLLRLLCGLEVPDGGTVSVGGVGTATKEGRRQVHQLVGYVMQHPERQLFAETVREDVSFGPRNRGLAEDEVARRCEGALRLVGLAGLEDASPFELSGGQRRLCAIAGILAMRPRILVMDEPTAGLDPRGRTELGRILGSLHERGVTIIEVTHSRFIAVRVQRVFVLDQSHLTMSGTPRQVFSYPNEGRLHEAGLGLPTALEWARRLRADGVPCTEAPLTLEELARSLAPQARKGDA